MTTPAPGTITQAEADAKLEEEKQKLKEDLEKKHADALKMVEMRNSLKLQSKEKEVQKLKDQLGTTEANGTAGAKPSSPNPATLNPVAPAFSPNAATRPPMRPNNPVRQMNNGRPVRPEVATAAPTPTAAAVSAPGIRGLPARPGRIPPVSGPGQSRLRPPLSARNAAAATVATPAAPPAAAPATAPPALEATTTVSEPVATITATPAPATPAPTQPTGRVVIKRRREDDLPASIAQLQTSNSVQESKASDQETATKSPSAGPTVINSAGSETRSSPLVIKRQRPLPVVEAAASTPAAPETRTVTIQRSRVTGVTDSSETPPASPPTNSTGATVEVATPAAPNVPQKTAPHGQKRRLQATETVQESITLASTPGPTETDYIDEVSTPEPSHESMAMDVDDAPPVKRLRPSTHVEVTDVTEEDTSASATVDMPSTPGNTTDLEEGEMEEVSTPMVTEVEESAPVQEEEQYEVNESVDADAQQQQPSGEHEAEQHEAEQELIQETTGSDEVLEEEYVDEEHFGESEVHETTEGEVEEQQAEVQTPQAHEAEEAELDLDLDHPEESTA